MINTLLQFRKQIKNSRGLNKVKNMSFIDNLSSDWIKVKNKVKIYTAQPKGQI